MNAVTGSDGFMHRKASITFETPPQSKHFQLTNIAPGIWAAIHEFTLKTETMTRLNPALQANVLQLLFQRGS